MSIELIIALVSAILGSNVITALVTVQAAHRKTSAEATDKTVQTVLALEERAHERYKTTAEALDEAEKLLRYARDQLTESADYIKYLQQLLCQQGVEYETLGERRSRVVSE